MIHKVDLRDHSMHSDYSHELKFLEAPDWLYRRMTQATGRPNRQLINVYRDVLVSQNVTHEMLVTRLAGVGEIRPHLPYEEIDPRLRQQSLDFIRQIRPRLASTFNDVADEDISIAGFFLTATVE